MEGEKFLSLFGENKLKVMIESGEITRPDVHGKYRWNMVGQGQ